MKHCDPELLALLALGEQAASPEEQAHLDGCEDCRDELRALQRPVAASRRGDEQLSVPGPRVWSAISAELGLDPELTDPLRPAATRRPRRRFARPVLAAIAAAAAVALLGGVGVALLQSAQPTVLATAQLRAFPDWAGSSGSAVVERLSDGRRVVRVTTSVPLTAGSDHEVWLMTAGAQRLVSLGLLRGSGGVFAVPQGVDLSRFHLVDVSEEPRDGNPTHSGDSIVRGALRS